MRIKWPHLKQIHVISIGGRGVAQFLQTQKRLETGREPRTGLTAVEGDEKAGTA